MAKNPKLPKHVVERRGVLQYYRRVPADLAGHPDWRGKKFVRVSLRTSDLRYAATEAGIINADYEKRFREARAEMKGGSPVLPMMPDLDDSAAVAFVIDGLTSLDCLIAAVCEIAAPALLPGFPYPVGASPAQSALTNGHGVRTRATLKALIERFTNDPGRGGKASEYEPMFEMVLDILGSETVVDTITPDDIERARDVISYLPPYATNVTRYPEWKGMHRASIAADVKERLAKGEPIRLLLKSAVNKYLGQLGTLFRYAENKGMHFKCPVARDIKLKKIRQKEDKTKRASFPIQRLKLVFPAGFGGFMTDVKIAPRHRPLPRLQGQRDFAVAR